MKLFASICVLTPAQIWLHSSLKKRTATQSPSWNAYSPLWWHLTHQLAHPSSMSLTHCLTFKHHLVCKINMIIRRQVLWYTDTWWSVDCGKCLTVLNASVYMGHCKQSTTTCKIQYSKKVLDNLDENNTRFV